MKAIDYYNLLNRKYLNWIYESIKCMIIVCLTIFLFHLVTIKILVWFGHQWIQTLPDSELHKVHDYCVFDYFFHY